MSYEPRTNCAKMCVELSMWNEAADVLEGLLREDDRFVEIWYLAGLSYRHLQVQKFLASIEKAYLYT